MNSESIPIELKYRNTSLDSFSSSLSTLEQQTIQATILVKDTVAQWMIEGDGMFDYPESKVIRFVALRKLSQSLPRYEGVIDVRDPKAIPNSKSNELDDAFAKFYGLWKMDPLIQELLVREKEDNEKRHELWFGSMNARGERDNFLRDLLCRFEGEGDTLSEREIEAHEMVARRAYCLPTITTPSELVPV